MPFSSATPATPRRFLYQGMAPERFKQIALRDKDRLQSYAAWLLGDREEAADVVQEALMRLWVHRDRVEEDTAGAWLLRTAHRLCMDRFRRRDRVERRETAWATRAPGGEPVPGPEAHAARRERDAAVAAALQTLGPRDRAVILLRDVHGLSYAEAAEVLLMTAGALKAALHRARTRLREAMRAAEIAP